MTSQYTGDAAFQVNSTTAGNQQFSSVASLSDGTNVVAWDSSNEDGSHSLYVQCFDTSGIPTTGEVVVLPNYSNLDGSGPSVAALSDGGFIVVWHLWDQQQGVPHV